MPPVERFVSSIGLVADGEYAPEPDPDALSVALPLIDLAERRASLVLGEPGAGKTTAMRFLASALPAKGFAVRSIDLRDCISDSSLERAFDGMDAPSDPSAERVLLLDSVDEAAVLIRNSVRFLTRRLTELWKNGWRVIASCRTAESVRAIDSLFNGIESDAVHVLLPLRRSDVKQIVQAERLDVKDFVRQVSVRRLDFLAAIPFTLNLLCKIFRADNAFPDSRAEVFERAVALMIAEHNVDGYSPLSNAVPVTFPSQLKAAAKLLAAYAAFTDSSGFALFKPGEPSSGTPTDALLGRQNIERVHSDLSNADLQEALRTALFVDSGPNRRQFTHRRLRDYLGAKLLATQPIDDAQIRSIIIVADGQSIPPQMADVATWLVAFDPDRFGWIIELDPLSLVRNRIAEDVPQLAGVLAKELIDRSDDVRQALSWQDELSGLEHDSLTSTLEQAIDGSSAQMWVALRILRDSYVRGLEERLTQLVTDTRIELDVRLLVAEIIEKHNLGGLLAFGDLSAPDFFETDVNAELRGTLLRAMWPNQLSVAELSDLLIDPPEHIIGMYFLFLRHLEEQLTPDLARAVLRRDASRGDAHDRELRVRDTRSLVDASIREIMGSAELDAPSLEAIAMIARRRIVYGREKLPFEREGLSDVARRRLIGALVRRTTDKIPDWYPALVAVDRSGERLLDFEDLDWIASEAIAAEAAEQEAWIVLADRLLDAEKPRDMEWAWDQRETVLWSKLRYRFDAVTIGSELAIKMRETWELFKPSDEEKRAEMDMPAEEYLAIANRWREESNSNPENFWGLVRWLDRPLKQGRRELHQVLDLGGLANRDLMSDLDNAQMLDMAYAYLTATDPAWPSKLKPDVVYFKHQAAYQALHSIHAHDPNRLRGLDVAAWTKLNPSILETWINPTHDEDRRIRREILAISYESAPAALGAAIRSHLGRIARDQTHANAVEDLAPYVELPMEELIRSSARAGTRHRDAVLDLYFALDEVRAEKWIRGRFSRSSNPGELGHLLGRLMDVDQDEAIDILMQFIRDRPALAEEGIPKFVQHERFERRRLLPTEPRALIALFEALSTLFPPSTDRLIVGVHSVSPREETGEWRDNLLESVIQGGTREGLAAMVELDQRRPDLELGRAVARAREAFRVNGWSALSLDELSAVLSDSRLKLARSNDDVLRFVEQALHEMKGWLTGETSQAFCLWDEANKTKNPKDENRLSDWYCHGLRLLLADRGLIINREVEVSNASGRGVGHRQDIRVEVRDVDAGESYIVVIEVKGIWNPGVKTDLKSQLVDDYLTRGGLSHGVYLVVAFPPDEMSSRSKASKSRSNLRGLISHLETQVDSIPLTLRVTPLIHTVSLSVA